MRNITKLLGLSVWVHLVEGGQFWFKVDGCGPDYITGTDAEGMNLLIKTEDIYKLDIQPGDLAKMYNLDRFKKE